jgi:hypothetical protein
VNSEVDTRKPVACQKVAGGRSDAETPGSRSSGESHPEGVPEASVMPLQNSRLKGMPSSLLFAD